MKEFKNVCSNNKTQQSLSSLQREIQECSNQAEEGIAAIKSDIHRAAINVDRLVKSVDNSKLLKQYYKQDILYFPTRLFTTRVHVSNSIRPVNPIWG